MPSTLSTCRVTTASSALAAISRDSSASCSSSSTFFWRSWVIVGLENAVDPGGLVGGQAQILLKLSVLPPRETKRLSAEAGPHSASRMSDGQQPADRCAFMRKPLKFSYLTRLRRARRGRLWRDNFLPILEVPRPVDGRFERPKTAVEAAVSEFIFPESHFREVGRRFRRSRPARGKRPENEAASREFRQTAGISVAQPWSMRPFFLAWLTLALLLLALGSFTSARDKLARAAS